MPDLFNLVGAGPLLVIVAVIIVALLASYVASRYRVANANEALIVAGSRGAKVRDERGEVAAAAERADKGIKVVVGGGTFVLPLIHKVGRLKLTARQIGVALPDAVTSQGIKVAVQGVATFKIGRDVESIRNAAERFLDAKDEQVDSIVKNVLEGSLRSIVGTLTIEELIMDRQKLLQQVQDSAKGDLATSGLQIDAFTIQSINDESGYVDLLGQQKLAIVERDARVAKAGADQEAAVREAEAQQIKINAGRDVALREAEVQTQTAAAQARAAQSGPLAQAEAQQEVTRRQTELADLEAARKEKELLASTVRPAEAEAEAVVRRADGDRQAKIAAAQAEAERAKLAGQAEADVDVAKGEAQARVVRVNAEAEALRVTAEGNAEAEVTLTKGEAEAKALALRAEAFRLFNDAAIIQTVLGQLPDIVRAAAEPMASIDSLTVLSSDGASDVVRTTTRTVAEASAAVKGLTGLDVPDLIGRAMSAQVAGEGAPVPGTVTTAAGPDVPPTTTPRRGRRPGSAARSTPPSPATPPTNGEGEPAPRMPAAAAAPTLEEPMEAMRRAATSIPAVGTPAQVDLEIPDSAQADEVLARLGEALAAVPGIGRYRDSRLEDLAERGPRLARGLWNRFGARVDPAYRELTVGDIIDRAGSAG
ncbi:MAG TPA: SPFH domain-containing protein [Candidatus Limnocylindria bacterium]|nr:SPFH domain-containing protein [Candidatus Limnocylindria bacterium]